MAHSHKYTERPAGGYTLTSHGYRETIAAAPPRWADICAAATTATSTSAMDGRVGYTVKPAKPLQRVKAASIDSGAHCGAEGRSNAVNDRSSAPVEDNPFLLLDLPPEIVLNILELAVVTSSKNDPININAAVRPKRPNQRTRNKAAKKPKPAQDGRTYRRGTARLLQPAITRTCRFLRYEGLKMFYQRNVFFGTAWSGAPYPIVQPCDVLGRWLSCIAELHASKIPLLYLEAYQAVPCVCDLARDLAGLTWVVGCGSATLLCENIRISMANVAGKPSYQVRLAGGAGERKDEMWQNVAELRD